MKVHAFRLKPGQDLKLEIEAFAKAQNIQAGFIITGVAGLKVAKLRMAGAKTTNHPMKTFEGPLEVDGMVGTVSVNGCHIHVTVSDKNGNAYGGHLKEGCIVYPTAEIVIGEDEAKIFKRLPDTKTGFDELVVE